MKADCLKQEQGCDPSLPSTWPLPKVVFETSKEWLTAHIAFKYSTLMVRGGAGEGVHAACQGEKE